MDLKEIKLIPLLDTLKLEKISDDIYFSKKYSNYISNSRLGLLNPKQDGSPEKFFEGFVNQGYVESFSLGSAVHELVLQPEYFELAPDLNKPTAKLGAMADELYPVFENITTEDIIKASNKVGYYQNKITSEKIANILEKCKDYWNNRKNYKHNDKEQIFLDLKSRNTVQSCVDALNNNQYVQNLLHPKGIIQDPISENELAILLDIKAICPDGKEIIVKLKSKLDNFTIDFDNNILTVNDIKTIGKILSELDTNIIRYRYSREFAMYIYLIKLCAEKFYNMNNPIIKANYLAVSTIPNYYSKVRAVNKKEIMEGFHEFSTLLRYAVYLMVYKNYEFI